MKKVINVSAGYKDLNPSALNKLCTVVIESLTGNVHFPKCADELPDFTIANKQLAEAIAAQKPGDTASTSAMHDAEEEVKRYLRLLAARVEFDAKNDVTKILTSGFSVAKQTKGSQATGFKAKQGKQSGTIDAASPSYKRAAYIWYISPDPIGTWTQVEVTTTTKFTYKNLAVGLKHWVKVIAKQGEETVFTADPIMIHVV